jgi:hypothetical protein
MPNESRNNHDGNARKRCADRQNRDWSKRFHLRVPLHISGGLGLTETV